MSVHALKSVNESQDSILIVFYSDHSGCNSNRNIDSDNKAFISYRKRGESLTLECFLKYNYVRFKMNNDIIPIQVCRWARRYPKNDVVKDGKLNQLLKDLLEKREAADVLFKPTIRCHGPLQKDSVPVKWIYK
ncbi:hypothetical protein AVEN_198453-1 [Araneus ventricosus]|uniref:Uncharacterized protein n=1 Tax=Araneus ventricosus TaxID=182803 RepID=A0A4Y2ETU2_ARAVE|nr:hypothetical protein AVEN_198453-1 [Araneus ventricosus]